MPNRPDDFAVNKESLLILFSFILFPFQDGASFHEEDQDGGHQGPVGVWCPPPLPPPEDRSAPPPDHPLRHALPEAPGGRGRGALPQARGPLPHRGAEEDERG